MRAHRLAPPRVFAARLWRQGLWAVAVVAAALAVGMLGYASFGNMGWIQAFANAAMILSGMGPLDKLPTAEGMLFEGAYALVSGLVFFAVAGIALAPLLHRLLHRFHIEDAEREERNRTHP